MKSLSMRRLLYKTNKCDECNEMAGFVLTINVNQTFICPSCFLKLQASMTYLFAEWYKDKKE